MRVLLYAPELPGHPQVYCRVIGDILLEAGHEVVIATGVDETGWAAQWRDLRPFAADPRVHVVDTRRWSIGNGSVHLRAEDLARLQGDLAVDSSLLLDYDRYLMAECRRIATGEAPRLRGRNAAVFANTCEWYPGEHPYTGERRKWVDQSVRKTLALWKRTLVNRTESARYFYENILLARRPIDAVIVKDERVAARFGPPVFWMPEIYKVFGAREEERRMGDWEAFAEPIREYVKRAGASNILLFFGTGAWYKGYDLFLRLAEIEPSIHALHAGAAERDEPGKNMAFDTKAIRERLRGQGRLYETNAYVESEALVELVFGSIERFVSTHRLTLSSGTMLQALDAGKPVLVPGSGLVGYRTAQYNLGMTYRYFDDRDLAEKWREFGKAPHGAFASSIADFMGRFSRAEVARFFLSQLCS